MARQKHKTKKTKLRRGAWFIPVRGSYLPATAAGWWTYVPFSAYLILSGLLAVKYTDTWPLAVLIIAPNWLVATAVMTYIASRKS